MTKAANDGAAITGQEHGPVEIHDTIVGDDQLPLERLQQRTGLSRQKLKRAMANGSVWLTRGSNTRRLRRGGKALLADDQLHLYYDPRIQDSSPPQADLIADQAVYSVWRKPYGMWSQGSKWGDHCSIGRWAETHLRPERTSFIVHRLDRAASGLILLAHNKRVASALSGLFRSREIEKRYRAVIHGRPPISGQALTIDSLVDGKEALSEVRLLVSDPVAKRSLVEVSIQTGRKHQIRRHLSQLGHPVVGDRLYGSGEKDGVDLQLAATFLRFRCPVQQQDVEFHLAERWTPTLT